MWQCVDTIIVKAPRYTVVALNKDWTDAMNYCWERGLRLVTIRSKADQLALEQFLAQFSQYKTL